MRTSHKRVLAMFRMYGPMTDVTLGEFLNEAAKATEMPEMSPSAVRSRRSELVHLGLVRDTGETEPRGNRKLTVWGIVK